MRIALVSEHASPLTQPGGVDAGGQNVHVAALAASLAAQGNQVSVFTRRDGSGHPDRVRTPAGYDVVHLRCGPAEVLPKDELLPHIPQFAEDLARTWATEPPDVVHAHFWMSGLASMTAAADLGIPVVQTYHALGSVKQRYQGTADTSPERRIENERDIGLGCAQVIATSRDEVGELAALGVDPAKVAVIPCGVDVEHFSAHGPRSPRTPRTRLVAVGRLVPRKGFDTAIKALRQLPDAELVIAGGPDPQALRDDPEAVRLMTEAREAKVQDRVRLLGRVSRTLMPALLRSADVVLSTPWYEPFGIVPLEAMACGRPVVATAVGGQLDTVREGVTGHLVPPQDPDALAAALRPLLADRSLREAFGAAGNRRVLRHYTWPLIARRSTEVYRRAIATAERSLPLAVGS
jgi:glycosyltransferase involved in cell wall biosynthesis